MIRLESASLSLSLEDNGTIVSLIHKQIGENVISIPASAFFLNFADENCKENLVWAEEQEIVGIKTDEYSADFSVSKLKIDNGRADAGYIDCSVVLHVRLQDEKIVFSADVDNSSGMRILDFQYPCLGKIKTIGNGKPSLLWPDQPGKIYHNIGDRLATMPPSREYGSNLMRITYPAHAMMGLCALLDHKESLFISLRDPDFTVSQFVVKGMPEDEGAVTVIANKNLCAVNGKISVPPVEVLYYVGDWHRGANDYVSWMESYRPKHKAPEWVRKMTGYFLVINKQQFGYEMWDYGTLPQLYDIAKAHGFDTLGLFGWYQTGHDNNYPNLEVSSSMGGKEALKEGIEAVHEKGGRVTLYYQGHLIDMQSPYFLSGMGQKVSLKNIWGNYYAEYYPKSHRSDFMSFYSRKMFAIACPACKEWQDLMTTREKWVASFGADGTLYDQLGGIPPYICFDDTHPHDGASPSRAFTGGRRKLLNALQNGSKEIDPEFAFMSEHITDLYSAYLDMCHGIGVVPGNRGERRFSFGSGTGVITFPELFRYSFPETRITLRNPNPFISKRFVNLAFTYGFIPEMELRYRQDKLDILNDKYAEQRQYAAAVSALRGKYSEFLIDGIFRDTESIDNPDPSMIAKVFVSDSGCAVTIWNDSGEAKMPDFAIEGKKLISFETPHGFLSDHFELLKPDEIAIAVFD